MPGERELVVMRKALHPEKEHRFSNAQEMLKAFTGDTNISASDVPPVSKGKLSGAGLHGFDAIAGMAELKEALSSEVLGPLREPEKYRSYGLSIPNGMLLYGPPGAENIHFGTICGGSRPGVSQNRAVRFGEHLCARESRENWKAVRRG